MKNYPACKELSHDLRFPTMWYVRPAKAQTRLRIGAVWSEPLLVAWIFYDCKAADWTAFGVSKLNRRLYRLVWVYTCQNATLLEIPCCGSITRWITPGRRQSKTLILSTNVDHISLETEFLIGICRLIGDKWQSKTLFLEIFDPHSSIVKS